MTDQTISTAGQAVLITGGSSGIGRAIAVHLAQQGFTVLATVRKQAAADALRELNEPNLVPLHPLDLTRREHIPPIAEAVAAELDRIYLHSTDGWEVLIDWTPHPAISADSPNRLEVIGQGMYFTFNINNAFVADYSDERLSQGAVGLLVGL